MELLSAVSLEKVVIRKGLQSGSLAYGQTTTLRSVVVDEIVPILGNVARYSGARMFPKLNPEAVNELS